MKICTNHVYALVVAAAGVSLTGCTNLINQNTDGNHVYTGVDDDATSSPEFTGGDAESSSPAEGSGQADETSSGETTDASTGGGFTDTGGGTEASTGTSDSTGVSTSGSDDTAGETTGGPQPDDSDAVSVVTGSSLSCVVKKSGKVRCWGYGPWGQHGLATTANLGDDETPDTLPDVQVGFDVVQLVAGDHFLCARSQPGEVRCWGRGTHGVLGTGKLDTIGDDEHPADAPAVTLPWPAVEIAAGETHACARSSLGRIACWGQGLEGQLGYGNKKNIGDDELPSDAGEIEVGGSAVRLFAGGATTCAVLADKTSRCWGRAGTHGRGTETIGDDEAPASVPPIDLPWPVEEFASGGSFTCARQAAADGGEVRCFGQPALYPNGFGQGHLGSGNLDPIWEASEAPPVALEWPAAQISAYAWHTCARALDGRVKCWGSGFNGRLGYGNHENVGDDETPADVGDVLLGFPALQVSAGHLHTCSLRAGGALRCWGWNAYGELGLGVPLIVGDDEEPFFGPDTPYKP